MGDLVWGRRWVWGWWPATIMGFILSSFSESLNPPNRPLPQPPSYLWLLYVGSNPIALISIAPRSKLALVFIVENLKFWIFVFVFVVGFFFGGGGGLAPPQECWALLALPIKEKERERGRVYIGNYVQLVPQVLKKISPHVLLLD
jgi:hypothetical protein